MSDTQVQHWAEDPEKIEAFLLRQLKDDIMVLMNAHLEQCRTCRQRILEQSELIEGIRQHGRKQMKYRLQQQLLKSPVQRYDWTHIVSIAAALVIIFGTVFVIRELLDNGQKNNRTREIVLADHRPSYGSLWITGTIITTRQFKGQLSDQSNKFIMRKGNVSQVVFIQRANITDLPLTQRTSNESIVRTLLERTPQGLTLTLYTDSVKSKCIGGIEPITEDSLIVYYQGLQIALHIPGGWTGTM